MGIITSIVSQKKNKDRISLFIDEEFAFGIHIDILIEYGLEKGMEINEDFISTILKEEEQKRANSYALNLLSYRMRSEKEIIDKMKNKEYEEDVIHNTIKFLKNYNYLNDNLFAELYIKDKMTINNIGQNRIKQELYNKGIDKQIIAEVVEKYVDKDEEYLRALEVAQKRIISYKGEEKQKIYRKLGSYLQRRGFSYELVSKILQEIL